MALSLTMLKELGEALTALLPGQDLYVGGQIDLAYIHPDPFRFELSGRRRGVILNTLHRPIGAFDYEGDAVPNTWIGDIGETTASVLEWLENNPGDRATENYAIAEFPALHHTVLWLPEMGNHGRVLLVRDFHRFRYELFKVSTYFERVTAELASI